MVQITQAHLIPTKKLVSRPLNRFLFYQTTGRQRSPVSFLRAVAVPCHLLRLRIMEENNAIWTIGHSTRSFEELVAMLRSFNIQLVADIRNYPGSRRFPQFNKDSLEVTLPQQDMEYIHLKDLGGRRKPAPFSKNTAWRNAAFRGYADYMETDSFIHAVKTLETAARKHRTAFMCSEAVWWRCHRALVSDYLKAHGWTVVHIMGIGKKEDHPYTSAAKLADGQLSYAK